MRVFLSAGEASGDAYAAFLMRELAKAASRPLEFEALGGPLLRQEGARINVDSSTWGAVGIVQALKMAPRATIGFLAAKKHLQSGPPGLFIPIDFGFVNIRLCRAAKAAGWKVLYFIPPGSWRKDRQGRHLPELTDAIVTPFSWSAEILQKMGATAVWYGHPILQLAHAGRQGEMRRGETIAILPGSRWHEIKLNLPVIAAAVGPANEPLQFIVAPTVPKQRVVDLWKTLAPHRDDAFETEGKYAVLRSAKAAIVCSGTATLEAALCACPMVVLYKVSALMHLQGFLMGLKKNPWFSLPNIFLQRTLLPEVLGWRVGGGDLRRALDAVLAHPEVQLAGFRELEAILGADQAISDTAKLASERFLA